MENRTSIEDEIQKAEQYEALKQMLLRLLEDPQVQQKIVTLRRHRLGADPGDERDRERLFNVFASNGAGHPLLLFLYLIRGNSQPPR